MVNVEVLRKELEFITSNQEEWNQEQWSCQDSECGTTACLGGWTVIHAGYELIFDDTTAAVVLSETGKSQRIETVANILLDLPRIARFDQFGESYYSDHPLFEPQNTLTDLWRIANRLTNGEIEIPIKFQE